MEIPLCYKQYEKLWIDEYKINSNHWYEIKNQPLLHTIMGNSRSSNVLSDQMFQSQIMYHLFSVLMAAKQIQQIYFCFH